MLITPQFSCSQTEDQIIVEIHVKYVKISSVDFFVEGNNFRFSLTPYFLSINFPGDLQTAENCKSTYDPETGILLCYLDKITKGENFPDLGMIGKLLSSSSKKTSSIPNIVVFDQDFKESTTNYTFDELNEIVKKDYLAAEMESLSFNSDYQYGFNNSKLSPLASRQEELVELFTVNPEITTISL